jgi:hypothetical protein
MKKLLGAGTVLISAFLLSAFGGSARASFSYYAPSLPWSTPINQCIGGAICGGTNNTLIVSTPPAYIKYVNVKAHDDVGDKHSATLEIYVDGVFIASQDVLKAGSILYYPVNRNGSTITLRSIRADGSSDETHVNSIEILP